MSSSRTPSSGGKVKYFDTSGRKLTVGTYVAVAGGGDAIARVTSKEGRVGGEPHVAVEIVESFATRRRRLAFSFAANTLTALTTQLIRSEFAREMGGSKLPPGSREYRDLYGTNSTTPVPDAELALDDPDPPPPPPPPPQGGDDDDGGSVLDVSVSPNDLGKLRAIYGRYPHIGESVKDRTLTAAVVLKMDDDQLDAAEQDIAEAQSQLERRRTDAFSRTRAEAEGRAVDPDVHVRYAHVDLVSSKIPAFVSSLPPSIHLYRPPSFSS